MILEAKNIVKRYGEHLAIDNASLSVREGQIFGLLGPNGAGKTTMINIIVGLLKSYSGEVNIFGKDLLKDEMHIKSQIGIAPQEVALFYDLTAYENVTFFGRLYGLKGKELKDGVKEALEFTELWDRRKDYPKQYSGGMKRRLNIACAIVHKPKLIIMDEPTVGIDPQSRIHILNSIKKLNKMGSTIIYTSHYMEEIEELCDEIVIMDKGKVIAKGTKEELKELIATEDKVSIGLSNISYTIIDKIKKAQGVKECVIDNNVINIISKSGSANLSEIIDVIAGSGGEINKISMDKPSLEGVFLTLTGRKLRD
ncbi:ABC transporter ATP-binding protein [Clostridium botulinum]|uniref:Antibiotic ABC transporter ATP-binding protein n=1 Tax=Clostridium botulinum C/D str. DC5 TaxID=1443128 RepID=A0A0A0IHH5_CLOBO|nr:ABC transporter ATP-binding protein [Clostridium botulinum]KEI06946.1 antibiotic ABC transporter ATP-binding protein [Clostridium botulinum C/D str. BKT75002]KEI08242.1 antibiotic ABC transporter ATP-binding protein [Clostridium botulinum C/D str. BKT2873]KGM95719.1 antibiotic ABC transporter ATP-binding protein [Clostridium botulinum D str. CCUG 7971]KGN00438.1 antibiotic ABC transporter ATP-binding protein [Clostridium botulinum C/D str. DC5]MCD3233579.1 ABC transporter ATP-binding protei